MAQWQLEFTVAVAALGAVACTDPAFERGPQDDAALGAPRRPDPQVPFDTRPNASADAATVLNLEELDAAVDAPTGRGSEAGASAPSDASTPMPVPAPVPAPMPDGDAGLSSVPRNGAKLLVGTYAKRSVTFSYDGADPLVGPFNTRNIEDAILTISENGDQLEASIQLCRFEVQLIGSLPLYFKNATALPPLRGRLTIGPGDTFTSEVMSQQFGFDRARADCGSGTRRDKYEDQTWNVGPSCDCPASRLPDALSDCRVIDSDGDQKPGITARAQRGLSAQLSDLVMAFESTVAFADGRIAANRQHTVREVRSQAQSCLDPKSDGCYFGANELCPGGSTKLIHREQVTCATFPDGEFGPLLDYPARIDCRAAER